MSREVDERVVEMRFDNAQFERGTRETMSTLDKLKKKLRFEGAEEGFENLSKASQKVDFSEMDRALDTIQMKFNALDVIAVTALQRVADKVFSTGERMVKSLSIDQVTAGWSKYAEKTSSVQTIMNATGKSIDQVNGYLSKLMWFSDETSYGFTDMTSALAMLTSSGGDIEKLIPMIMGIANATAYAGKGATEFSRAIFNLAQSYGTGSLQLIDWKSVAQAGVGSEQLKQILIDTAVELGTLKEGAVTVGTFENSLQKKWATTAVMEKGFGRFAELTEAAYQAVKAGQYDTTSQAIEALADSYDDVAVKAFKSAQEAKSFSEVVSSTKDAVSSKWLNIFENVLGNYEEATAFWTEMANRLYDIFVPPIEDLGDRLKEALDSGWTRFRDEELGSQADVYTSVLEEVALKSGAISEEALTRNGGIAGALKAGAANANLLAAGLKKAQKDAHAVLDLSDAEIAAYGKSRTEVEAIAEAFDELNERVEAGDLDLKEYAQDMRSLSGREHLMQSLWNLWDAIEKVLTPIAQAFHEVFAPANSKQIYSFAEGLDNLTAKLILSDEAAEHIKQVFKGLFSILKIGTTAISTVAKTAANLAGTITGKLKPLASVLLEAAAGLGTLLSSGSLTDKVDRIRTSLQRLLDPLGEVRQFLAGFDLKTWLRETVQNGTAQLRNWLEGWLGQLPQTTQTIARPVLRVLGQIAMGSLTVMGAVAAGLGTLLGNAKQFGSALLDGIRNTQPTVEAYGTMLTDLPHRIGQSIQTFAQTFRTNLSQVQNTTEHAYGPVSGFFTALKEGFDSISGTDVYRLLSLIDVGLLAFTIGQLAKAAKSFSSIVSTLFEGPIAKAFDAMAGSFKALSGALKSWTKTNNSKVMLTIASSMLLFAASAAILSNAVDPDRFSEIAGVLLMFGILLTGAAKLLEPAAIKMENAFEGLKARVLDSARLWGVAAALVGLGIAVRSIAKGLTAMLEAMQEGNLAANAAALAVGTASIVSMILALRRLSESLVIGEKTMGHKVLLSASVELWALGAAIRTVAKALEPLSEIQFTSLAKAELAVWSLGGLLTSMATVLAGVQKLIGPTGVQNGAAVAAMASGIWILAKAVEGLALVPLENLDAGMTAVKTLLVLMTALSALSAKTKFSSGAAIFLMSSSLVVLAGAVGLFAAMGDSAVDGLNKVALGLTALSLASQLAGANGATSILTISGAMLVLAGAVAVYAQLGDDAWSAMFKCGTALAGMSIAVLTLSKLTGDALQAAWTINTLSGGMIKLAAACAIFNLVKWESLAMAGAALGGMIAILFGAGALATKLPLLSVGFTALGTAFEKFGSGALKLAAATAVLGVLSMFAGPICQAIVNAAPDIQAALIAVTELLCSWITQCAQPVAHALRVLIEAVVSETWQMLKDALGFLGVPETWGELFGDVGKAIKSALGAVFDPAEWIDAFTADDRPIGKAVNWIKGIAEDIINTFKICFGIHSPSTVMQENGKFVLLGLLNGLQDSSILGRLKNAMQSAASSIRTVFTSFWRIHSPSEVAYGDAQNIVQGDINALSDPKKRAELYQASYDTASTIKDAHTAALNETITLVQTKMTELYDAYHNFSLNPASKTAVNTLWNKTQNTKTLIQDQAPIPGKKGITTAAAQEAGKTYSVDDLKAYLKSKVKEIGGNIDTAQIENLLSKVSGGDYNSILDFFQKSLEDSLPETTPTGTSPKTKGSKTKSTKEKTAAEQLVEEYTKKLKSNKYLQDVADKTWALWEAGEGQDAGNAAYLAKKGEALDKAIELQTARVSIAQEQYDKLKAEASATEDQKNEAYATWLDEQKSLTELKRGRYESLYKEVLERYENQTKTAESEYELWTALNEKTAGITEKSNRKIDTINKKIGIQAEALAAAEQEYIATKNAFQEGSEKTQEAYRKYLNEQISYQELLNELHEAQLSVFDERIERYTLEMKTLSNRQQMLLKLFEDGDYGIVTGTINITGALQNMGYELRKMESAEAKYNEFLQNGTQNTDEGLEALHQLQEERYNFVGFAENFADALYLGDDAKQIIMQVGAAMGDNWTYLKDGFLKAWNQMETSFPEVAKKFANLWGLFQRDGLAETIASGAAVFMNVMEGSYGMALSSALNLALQLATSDFGQTLLGAVWTAIQNNAPWLAQLLLKLFGKDGIFAGFGSWLFGENGVLKNGFLKLFGETGVITTLFAKLIGETGIITGLVESLAGVIGVTVPQLGLIALAIAAIGFAAYEVWKHWDELKAWFQNFWASVQEGFTNLWNGITEFAQNAAQAIGNFFRSVWEVLTGIVQGAIDIGTNIVKGIVTGMTHAAKAIGDGIKNVGSSIVEGFKNFFGIHSPSTVMAGLGEYLGLGFANGIDSTKDRLTSVLRSLIDPEELDTDLALRPVLDLSGSAWMQSAFARNNGQLSVGTTRTADLMAADADPQNGGTARGTSSYDGANVVNAVEKLGDRVDKLSKRFENLKLVLDSGKTVGYLAPQFDGTMGQRNILSERGVI